MTLGGGGDGLCQRGGGGIKPLKLLTVEVLVIFKYVLVLFLLK